MLEIGAGIGIRETDRSYGNVVQESQVPTMDLQ